MLKNNSAGESVTQSIEPTKSTGLKAADLQMLQDAMRARGMKTVLSLPAKKMTSRSKLKAELKAFKPSDGEIERRELYQQKMAEKKRTDLVRPSRPSPKGVPVINADLIPKWIINKMIEVQSMQAWPVFITGPVGVGKTCVAAHFYCEWPESAKWNRFSQFCDRTAELLRDGESTFWEEDRCYEYSRESWWDGIGRMGLYVVDDVGVGEPNHDRTEALWSLLESRTRKPLILTSNLDDAGIFKQFDGRIQSRIRAGTMIRLAGIDQRAAGYKQRVAEGAMPSPIELPEGDWGTT